MPDGTFSAENIWGTCQIRGSGMAKGWTFEAVMHNGNDITNRVIEFGAGRSISGVEIVYTDRVGDLAVTVADERGTPTQDYVAIVFPVEKEKWGDQRFVRYAGESSAPTRRLAGLAEPHRSAGHADGEPGAGRPVRRHGHSTFVAGGMMSAGGNTLRNLLAGDYFVVAVEDAASEDLRDPEYLERLSQIATRVSVTAGGADRPAPPRQGARVA